MKKLNFLTIKKIVLFFIIALMLPSINHKSNQLSAQQLDATFSMVGNQLQMVLNADATFQFSENYSSSQDAITIIVKNVYNTAPSSGNISNVATGINYTTSTGKAGTPLNLGTYGLSFGPFIHTTDEQVSFKLAAGATIVTNETITFTAGTVIQSVGNYSPSQTFNAGPYTAVIPNSAFTSTAATMITSANAPTVNSVNASSVLANSANLGGNVTSNGGATVTERGVVYSVSSTNANPQIGGTGVTNETNGNGTGTFSENITGLANSTSYSYKAYATNSEGTSYGATMTFTTSDIPPTVTTTSASSVSGTSATLAGNVTNDGGATVTERGIVYSLTITNANPQIGDTGVTKDTNGSGTGTFSESINNLLLSTGYSFRAYAINAEGTSYGTVQTFTTLAGDTNSFSVSSGNWSVTTNWSLARIPISTDNIVVGTGNTLLFDVTSANVNDIDINAGGTLTILSGNGLTIDGNLTQNGTFDILSDATSNGSLIINGNSSGSANVNYLRYVTTNWHLVASPVNGQSINSLSGNVATNGNNFGIAPYVNNVTTSNTWNYYTTSSGGNDIASAGNFIDAKGYSIKKDVVAGTLNFSGTLNTTNKNIVITDGGDAPNGNRWNLVGNPYTASLHGNNLADATNNLLKVNIDAGNLDPTRAGLYFWNGTLPYEVKSVDDASFYIAPGQAFFVHAPDGGGTSVNFTENMQTHQSGNTFLKTSVNYPEIVLNISDSKSNSFTKIRYIENKTIGLDVGSDVGTFSGTASTFEVYTHLVSNDNTTKFAIQALPQDNYEGMIVPVGVQLDANKEIEFSLQTINFPLDFKITLEDRSKNVFTELNNRSIYKIKTDTALDGIGRFYIHTSQNVLQTENNLTATTITIFQSDANTIKISGLLNKTGNIKLFNFLGKQLLSTDFTFKETQEIQLPKVAKGIYIVQIESKNQHLNQKIIIE